MNGRGPEHPQPEEPGRPQREKPGRPGGGAERVRLRAYRLDDVADLVAGCGDPVTQRFTALLPSPYTAQDARRWIQEESVEARAAGHAAYVIADPVTDRLLGGVGLTRFPGSRAQAEIGYWVAPWARGRGVATTATLTLAAWAFRQGVHRLELITALDNPASQRVALNAGFRREGIARRLARTREGGWADRVVWARLADDPPGPTPRLLPDLPRSDGAEGALTDGVVRLRPVRPADADDMYVLQTLPEMVASSVPPVVQDRAAIAQRCAWAAARWLAGERADLVIADAASGALAGSIGLYYQDPHSGQAMIGYGLLPQWRGRGYATRAVRLLARWAFDRAGIARLVAGTHPDNTGSQRVLRQAGFRREGYLRGRLPGPDGTRVDDVLFGLLPGDLQVAGEQTAPDPVTRPG